MNYVSGQKKKIFSVIHYGIAVDHLVSNAGICNVEMVENCHDVSVQRLNMVND